MTNMCPKCGSPTQSTSLTPPDEGVAIGCTKCSWMDGAVPEDETEVEEKRKRFRERVLRIANAFKELDSDVERMDVLYGLANVMEKRLIQSKQIDGLLIEWMAQATASLKGVFMLMGSKEKK